MRLKAIAVGNSDGIGLATTKRLLTAGWDITGISRLVVQEIWLTKQINPHVNPAALHLQRLFATIGA